MRTYTALLVRLVSAWCVRIDVVSCFTFRRLVYNFPLATIYNPVAFARRLREFVDYKIYYAFRFFFRTCA